MVLRFIRAVLGVLLALGLLAAAAVVLLFLLPDGEGASTRPTAPGASPAPEVHQAQTRTQTFVARLKPQIAAFPPFRPIAEAIACSRPDTSDAAAHCQRASVDTAQVSPFGKVETGWGRLRASDRSGDRYGCGPDHRRVRRRVGHLAKCPPSGGQQSNR